MYTCAGGVGGGALRFPASFHVTLSVISSENGPSLDGEKLVGRFVVFCSKLPVIGLVRFFYVSGLTIGL